MKKIFFYSILILTLIATNLLTGAVAIQSHRFSSIGQIFMCNISSGERNRLLLQFLISRLRAHDPYLLNNLRQIRNEFVYSREGSNLLDLIRKKYPEEF